MSSTTGKRGIKRKAAANEGKNTKNAPKKPRKPKDMPDFKPGEVLVDLVGKRWRLGDLMCWGGFGTLYYVSPDTEKNVDNKATYVAKVEPHSSGPLYSEQAFYLRAAKKEAINKWTSSHNLKFLGVPAYIASGLHTGENVGTKYRFMIMERFGEDVDQIFAKCDKCFHIQTVLILAIRIIDILEYIHEQGYVHADIKGSNLMIGYNTDRNDKVFLVDYGLACRFKLDDVHKEYKEDRKRRHDGTIEFTSRDAHKGAAPSRRTDIEILGYVMLQWLCGKLPWEDKLTDKDYVMNSKISSMEDIPQLLKKCLNEQQADELEQYFNYTVALKYDQIPDYNKLRKIFQDGLQRRKYTDDGLTVKFKSGAVCSRKPKLQSIKEPSSPIRCATSKRVVSPAKPPTKRASASSAGKPKPMTKTEEPTADTDSQAESSTIPKKRGKGRPRKNVSVEEKSDQEENPARRKRGRPKKATVPPIADRGALP